MVSGATSIQQCLERLELGQDAKTYETNNIDFDIARDRGAGLTVALSVIFSMVIV